jgi:hypothetical protein
MTIFRTRDAALAWLVGDSPDGNSDEFRASGREKFDLNLRSHLEICHGKQAHADVAEIDTKSIQLGRLGEYLHRGVQQLAFPASPVWFEGPFEDHLSTGKDTVAKPCGQRLRTFSGM